MNNGVEEGKTLGVLGGIHGTEFASIEAVIRVIQELDPKRARALEVEENIEAAVQAQRAL